jgi:L-rhamnonate dehydratase
MARQTGVEDEAMKITAVRAFRVSGSYIAPPEDGGGRRRLTTAFIIIETDEGIEGIFGPLFVETAVLVRMKLAPHLLGQDPLATEHLWERLYRSDRHARKGYEMMAISAVDCALWDLRGKVAGRPVYRLLGGPTRERVDCYASIQVNTDDPAVIRELAQQAVAQGFKAQKWFFRYGPRDGLEGMEKNVALVRTVREAVGPYIEIMFDAHMRWDTTYAIRFLERVEEYRPRWLEEPVHPDLLPEFAAIRRTTRVPIATGEHEYTRWGFLQLLQTGGVDVLQADPDWCGGISELVKICVLASAFGRPVIPHGHSLYAALHVIASQPYTTCPMAEFLVRAQPQKQHFFPRYVQPEGGSIALPDTPGLGIALDEAKVEERVELP